MARTLSQDPRDRVVAAVEGGMTCRAASGKLDAMSPSSRRSASIAIDAVLRGAT